MYQIIPPRIIFSINSNRTVMILSKAILTTDYQTSGKKKKEIILCTTVALVQKASTTVQLYGKSWARRLHLLYLKALKSKGLHNMLKSSIWLWKLREINVKSTSTLRQRGRRVELQHAFNLLSKKNYCALKMTRVIFINGPDYSR